MRKSYYHYERESTGSRVIIPELTNGGPPERPGEGFKFELMSCGTRRRIGEVKLNFDTLEDFENCIEP